jgi:hypothetical protein
MKTKLIATLLLMTTAILAQDDHHKGVEQRGDHMMGFSHDKTTHHFRLYADGGAIEVTANDPKDTESRDQIRMHLSHIAAMFAAGNFKSPMLIHDQVPPGAPVLQTLKAELRYRYEDIDRGGRVRIATQNKTALAAVYEFLRFQIADHQTGDTTEITKRTDSVK